MLITYLNRVQFGAGSLSALADELAFWGLKRPLLIADRGVVDAGIVESAEAALPNTPGAGVYSETPPNPTEAAVNNAAALARGLQADCLIAIGGGSPIDLAKAVALAATHDEPLRSYAAVDGGIARITSAVLPVIAVPTTAGTGSEVGRAAMIVMDDGLKLAVASPYLTPKSAICDPELTLSLPPGLTAATGMDALTHCLEAFISRVENPPAAAIALDGLKRAADAIVRAVADGTNVAVRHEMMMASLEGGLAFQKGLGIVHTMSHALGSLQEPILHHGMLNAALLPLALDFARPVSQVHYPTLSVALGGQANDDPARLVADLNGRLGLPSSIGALGVEKTHLTDTLIDKAERDFFNTTTPRRPSRDEYWKLFETSLSGS